MNRGGGGNETEKYKVSYIHYLQLKPDQISSKVSRGKLAKKLSTSSERDKFYYFCHTNVCEYFKILNSCITDQFSNEVSSLRPSQYLFFMKCFYSWLWTVTCELYEYVWANISFVDWTKFGCSDIGREWPTGNWFQLIDYVLPASISTSKLNSFRFSIIFVSIHSNFYLAESLHEFQLFGKKGSHILIRNFIWK